MFSGVQHFQRVNTLNALDKFSKFSNFCHHKILWYFFRSWLSTSFCLLVCWVSISILCCLFDLKSNRNFLLKFSESSFLVTLTVVILILYNSLDITFYCCAFLSFAWVKWRRKYPRTRLFFHGKFYAKSVEIAWIIVILIQRYEISTYSWLKW